MILGLFLAVLVFTLDQLSKYYVLQFIIENHGTYTVCSHFNLVAAFNKGVSFSMFDGGGLWGRIILIVFALAVILFLLHWMVTETSKFIQISLGLIIGGAMGNVFDRLLTGAVFDFLDFHAGTYHWPAFNMADTFICIGALFIVFKTLLNKNKNLKKGIQK